MPNNIRLIAFYLPQFHPIPENDKWWGKGFTEWTNVGKAKPLFCGHYQPRVPADLGYYDLRVPETRKAQADMARKYGIEGFMYWHYWFGNGKRLLERPFNEVLQSGEPNFPFALAWANESWKGFAHGLKNRNVLIEQEYPGEEDYIAHFNAILPALKDPRYITVDGKPIFMIYKPLDVPDISGFIELWQNMAKENGLKGIYFIGHNNRADIDDEQIINIHGIDAVNPTRLTEYIVNHRSKYVKGIQYLVRHVFKRPYVYDYKHVSEYFLNDKDTRENIFPSVIPNWDHSPRSGYNAIVLKNSTPSLFAKHLERAITLVKHKERDHRIIFIKSWNEWAEGNYIEPDLKYGKQYLEMISKMIK